MTEESDKGQNLLGVTPGFVIRVLNHRKLPYPINIILPHTEGSEHKEREETFDPDRTLQIIVPSNDERHIKLGLFMDAWSLMEQIIKDLVSKLLKTDLRTVDIIMSSLGTKQVIDLVNNLGSAKLDEDNSKRLINLTERVSKANTKRNSLVHGHWVLEVMPCVKNGKVVLESQFVREMSSGDPRIIKLISEPKNQKERVKYIYTLKRIDGVISDVSKLKNDIVSFIQEITNSGHGKLPEASP